MNNKVFTTSNGLTMVKSKPYNWLKKHKYSNGTGPFIYSIYCGGIGEGHVCFYTEEEKQLCISYMMYSSTDPNLRFTVNSIEEAGEIVKKFVKGMNYTMKGTIYKD